MKLLLKAAIQNSRHLALAICTFLTLFALIIANQMEMCSLGVMANTGSDFFSLFGGKKRGTVEAISLEDVQKKWNQIDVEGNGLITKQEAALYMAKKRDANPLSVILHKVTSKFDIEKNFSTLALILICVAVFKAFALFLSRYTTQILAIRLTRDLRQQFFEHIQSLPLSFYNEYNLGSLTSRAVGDAGQIASSLNSMMTNYLQTPFTVVSSLGLCFYLSWQLSLVIFIGIPMIIFPVVFLTRRVKRVTRQLLKNQETFTSVLLDYLAGIQTVKIFAMEKFSLRKYKKQNDRMAQLESKSAKYSLLTRPVLHMITTACLSVVVIFGLHTLNMSVGQLLVFCGLLHLFYEPVKKFAEENSNIQRGVVAAERMYEVLHLKPSVADRDGAIPFTSLKSKIEFDHVWFKYNHDWILKDLSFTVEKGETVAIVGPTGAGKSTIVSLLPRLYDVQKGEIRIDGVPITDLSQKTLRDGLAFVPQRPFLFFDTVAENIAFGRDFSMEQIEESAKQAHAHEFIINLSEQYHSMLAETGKNLSGGQQQRLAIARALVKKSSILIMDEATSSLDAISEDKIKSSILSLHGKITQVLIAHRFSTIEHADKIIYLDRGGKIAEGSKEELLRDCAPFRLMWETFHRTKTSTLPI